jgi:CxxC-x17-CxxC domain-containing protein
LEDSVSRFADKVLACRDCGNQFVFSAGEQEFYGTRGFTEPTRCPECRAARKAARDGGSSYSDSGSRGGYGGGSRESFGGGRSQGVRQMYKVTCAECGQETEVPFEPRTGRPVYCRDCFDRRSGRR